MRKLSTVVASAVLLVLLTRYHIDNVNFARALDDFGRIREQAIVLPCGNVAWLDPVPAADQHAFDELEPAQQAGPFHVARVDEGRHFSIDGQQFAVASGP